MTEYQFKKLTHNLNKAVGEWELKVNSNILNQLPIYQMTLLFLHSFTWARFEGAILEGRGYTKMVSNLKELQKEDIDNEILFATINFSGLYFITASSSLLEVWVENSYKLELYNEENQINHPFLNLRVYPQLYRQEVFVDGAKINLIESSRLNQERFNQQFNLFKKSLNTKVDSCRSELGYSISDKGIEYQ